MSHQKQCLVAAASLWLIGHLMAPCAWAGIADSPLPVLEAGKKTFHLYSVPGILRTGTLGTFFSCTSTDTATMRVGVEIFSAVGGPAINDPVASSLVLDPGATRIFGDAAIGVPRDSVSLIGPITSGSARILATSRKLVCTAFVADRGNDPPTSAWQLTIVRQKNQKGD